MSFFSRSISNNSCVTTTSNNGRQNLTNNNNSNNLVTQRHSSNGSNSTTNSSNTNTQLVQSRSIQSTLQALAQETDILKQRASETTRERARLQQQLIQLRLQPKELATKIHVARDALGSLHKQQTLLTHEATRLQEQLASERRELEQACQEQEVLQQKETQSKRKFNHEMSQSVNELSTLLWQQEQTRLLELISVDTLSTLLSSEAPFLSNDILKELQEGLDSLSTASNDNQEAFKLYEQRKNLIEEARERVLQCKAPKQYGKVLSKENLEEMESIWEQNWDDSGMSQPNKNNDTGKETMQMKLFYGPDNLMQDVESIEEANYIADEEM